MSRDNLITYASPLIYQIWFKGKYFISFSFTLVWPISQPPENMPPKQHKQIPATAEVVDLDSSDEEGSVPPGYTKQSNSEKSQTKPPTTSATQSASAANCGGASAVNNRPLENRSFWRAGAYEIGTTKSTFIQGAFYFLFGVYLFWFDFVRFWRAM